MSLQDLMFPPAEAAPETTPTATAVAETPDAAPVETTPATPDAAPATPDAPETVPTDAEGTEAAAQPTTTTAAAPTAPVEATFEAAPVTFTTMGQTFPIPGAKQTPEGDVIIPKAQWATTARVLGDGVQWQSNFALLRQREAKADAAIRNAESVAAEKDAQSSVILTHLQEIMQDPEIAAYLGTRVKLIESEAKRAAAEKRAELIEARGRPNAAQQTEQLQHQIQTVLAQHGAARYPALFGNPALGARLLAKYVREADRFAVKGEDGRMDVNWHALEADIEDYAALIGSMAPRTAPTPAPTTTPPSRTATALNAAAKKPAPAPAKSVATPAGRDEKGRFTGAHPDMPTDPNDRARWIRERVGKGLPITA